MLRLYIFRLELKMFCRSIFNGLFYGGAMKKPCGRCDGMALSGFTLIEIMVTVVVIGILATIALPRYILTVEKGRGAEARNVLGAIRTAQTAYNFDNGFYASDFPSLSINVPTVCNASFYFSYGVTVGGGGGTFTATATRCTGGGRQPNAIASYVLNMTQDGTLDGTQGYL